MAHVPEQVRESELTQRVIEAGCERTNIGKVRDSHNVPGYKDLMLIIATDRVSIFDFVLGQLIPGKGAILTALTVYWLTRVFFGINHHLMAYGAGIDQYLPEELRGDVELQSRALVVRKLRMIPIEFIIRGCLTGSGLKSYKTDGTVCGIQLREGYVDGSTLDEALFTPSTKAEKGHDVNISFEQMVVILTPFFGGKGLARAKATELQELVMEWFKQAAAFAKERGIVLLDTKFEIGIDADGNFVLADEVLTPDSSRFSSLVSLTQTVKQGLPPQPMDKQAVRTWGKSKGIPSLDPENISDCNRVAEMVVSRDILYTVSRLYRYIFFVLTGMKIEMFQRDVMDIKIELPTVRVEVVVGSLSDLAQLQEGLKKAQVWGSEVIEITGNIISAHRNPGQLKGYAVMLREKNPDAVICCAGKAAALPGVLKAYLCEAHMPYIPVIGVGIIGSTIPTEAARLSILELPGQSVEMQDGDPYMGEAGFVAALERVLETELPIRFIEPKEALLGHDLIIK